MDVAVLFALGAMIFWGVGDFLIQKSARKIGDIEALAWISLVGSIALIPFIVKDIAKLNLLQDVALLAVLGVIIFFASIFDFEALKKGKISVIEMVISLELPFTIMLGVLFFSEHLTTLQLVLIILLMIGVGMISLAGKKFEFRFEYGVWLGVVAAIFMALMNFLVAVSSIAISPLMAIWFPWLICTIICLIVLWRRNNGITYFFKHIKEHPQLIIFMALFDTAAWIFYAYAVAAADLGITTAITQSYPVIALLLGVTIGKEHITSRQYAGAAIAITAAIVLALMV